MDINSTNGNGNVRAQQRYREAMVDLVRRTRGKVQAAREEALQSTNDRSAELEAQSRADRSTEQDRRDRIEISRAQHHRATEAREDQADAPNTAQTEAQAPPTRESESRDRVDISRHLHARVQSARHDNAQEDDRMKVERLRMAYESGTLNTPERIDRAAENMLKGPATEPNA